MSGGARFVGLCERGGKKGWWGLGGEDALKVEGMGDEYSGRSHLAGKVEPSRTQTRRRSLGKATGILSRHTL